MNLVQIESKKNDKVLQAVLSYRELKAKIEFLEAELKTHKETLEEAAASTSEGKIVTEDYSVTLTIYPQDSFDKKAAFAKLGESVLGQFVKTELRKRLTVK
jgi:hypothetical protein